MTFSFNIYTMLLQVALVVYFELELGTLGSGQLLEGDETCHC